jgi:hypothetical protein
MSLLDLSESDAIQTWLEDNDYEVNEEQNALDNKARQVKVKHDAQSEKPRKKSDKPKIVKVSDEKKSLFSEILTNLEDVYRNEVEILKENKLIQVKIGNKVFKIDIIEQRPKKS